MKTKTGVSSVKKQSLITRRYAQYSSLSKAIDFMKPNVTIPSSLARVAKWQTHRT
ncbi:MAG: hypothetical protein NZM04_05655 [Methylacidiphilales bacterium]|nr:hypothetical protein [Candidatus Methylacidiphilales bacterium]MDW8349513.1 hypothetical protein [Verrucomicrobiae bacterium]